MKLPQASRGSCFITPGGPRPFSFVIANKQRIPVGWGGVAVKSFTRTGKSVRYVNWDHWEMCSAFQRVCVLKYRPFVMSHRVLMPPRGRDHTPSCVLAPPSTTASFLSPPEHSKGILAGSQDPAFIYFLSEAVNRGLNTLSSYTTDSPQSRVQNKDQKMCPMKDLQSRPIKEDKESFPALPD